MNPGPFNVKEHALIAMFANSGLSSPTSAGFMTIMKVFYHRKFSLAIAMLLGKTSQVILVLCPLYSTLSYYYCFNFLMIICVDLDVGYCSFKKLSIINLHGTCSKFPLIYIIHTMAALVVI